MCSPRKSNENFSIFTFCESKQMSLTQDLSWSLGRSIALQLQRQTDLLLCTINCFLQWDCLQNMAVGDLVAFYYTLYLCCCMQDTVSYTVHSFLLTRRGEQEYVNTQHYYLQYRSTTSSYLLQSFWQKLT